MKAILIVLVFLIYSVKSTEIIVGPGSDYESLSSVISLVNPGDTIRLLPGMHITNQHIVNLSGASENPIFIISDTNNPAIFSGGSTAIQFSKVSYLVISGITFTMQKANGLNIDDGGDFNQPSHNVIIENCTWLKMDASGNNDELKMSGVDSFTVRNNKFQNGSPGGSLIDMVGCHYGLIENNYFYKAGSNCIQAKGGTHTITIRHNTFRDGGQRAINCGGSTGLPYFRPQDANYEARDIDIYSNLFIGGVTPIGFVSAIYSRFINNTIINPERWVLRILQETTDTRFEQCSYNTFANNICYFNNSANNELGINIGSNTQPQTFIFRNNLWFNSDNHNWNGPNSAITHENSLVNINPEFSNYNDENFTLKENSKAIGFGAPFSFVEKDFFGNKFNEPRSIGAFEYINNSTDIEIQTLSNRVVLYPNPSTNCFKINIDNIDYVEIYDLNGKLCKKLDGRAEYLVNNLSKGWYLVKIVKQDNIYTTIFLKE